MTISPGDSQELSYADLQAAFLELRTITPASVDQFLLPLILRADLTDTKARQRNKWVSIAALQTITEPSRAVLVHSEDAARSLLEVGLTASQSLPEDEQGSSTLRTALLVADRSFKAWQKTGMQLRLQGVDAIGDQSETDASGLDEKDDDDDDAAWFESEEKTPSPAPPSKIPTVLLRTLLASLPHPAKTALLLSPFPDRLAVYLHNLDASLFDVFVWPQREALLDATLAYLAILEDDGVEGLATLQREKLFPRMDNSDLWSTLRQRLESGGDGGDPEIRHRLQTILTEKSDKDSSSTGPNVLDWYRKQALKLEASYGATRLAAHVCEIGLGQTTSIDSEKSWPTLQQLKQELQLSAGLSRPLQDGEGASGLSLQLAEDPVRTLYEHSSTSSRPFDAAAVYNAIGYAATSPYACEDAQGLVRQLCWKLASDENARSERIGQIQQLLAASQITEAEQEKLLLSIVLAADSRLAAESFSSLLHQIPLQPDSVENQATSLRAQLRHLCPSETSSGAAKSPSSLELYQALSKRSVATGDIHALWRRLSAWQKEYVGKASTISTLISSEVLPWEVVLMTTDETDQKRTLRSLARFQHFKAQSPPWLELHGAVLAQSGPTNLFEALTKASITEVVIEAAALHPKSSEEDLRVLVAKLSNSSDAELAERTVIQAGRKLIDRAQGGRNAVADLKRARTLFSASSPGLKAAPASDKVSPPSNAAEASLLFVNAVLRLMQLSSPLSSTLHPSLLMTPLEVRLEPSKLQIIRRWLSVGGDSSWRRGDDVLETAMGLCIGSVAGAVGDALDSDKEEPILTESDRARPLSFSPPQLLEQCVAVQVYAMLADAAMGHSDLVRAKHYVEKMSKSYRDLTRRSRRLSRQGQAADRGDEIERAAETVWTTLFAMSKHPNCRDEAARKAWMAEAVGHAPPERLSELLRRLRSTEATSENDEDEAEVAAAVSLAMKMQSGAAAGGAAHLDFNKLPSASAAAQAASGLGAGVFSLAAAAVNSSHWPLNRGAGAGASTSASTSAPRSSLERSGVGNALSSLAGQLGEGYSSRLTGLWGGAASPSQKPTALPNSGVSAPSGAAPHRSTAALFDDFGPQSGAAGNRSASPSSRTGYLDPAERAARAARGFLSGLRGTGAGSPQLSQQELASSDQPAQSDGAGAHGWAALSSRGMGWLMGDEEPTSTRQQR